LWRRKPLPSASFTATSASRTPVFEDTGLFTRSVGAGTDIVEKEMYTFQDRGENSLTLRPEGTAPVCRAYIEHGMHNLLQPVKLYYFASISVMRGPRRGGTGSTTSSVVRQSETLTRRWMRK